MSENEQKTWWVARGDMEILGVTDDLATAEKAVLEAFKGDNPDADLTKVWFDLRDMDYVLTVGPVPMRGYSAQRTELL
jgi:hypothetical protein